MDWQTRRHGHRTRDDRAPPLRGDREGDADARHRGPHALHRPRRRPDGAARDRVRSRRSPTGAGSCSSTAAPGLPRGMTMAEMAAEHADAIRELGAPVDVMGTSTGGSIAQQLAADHPDVVGRLVLLSTACRLGPEGKVLQRRVAARIRAGAYRQATAVMGPGVPPRGRSRRASSRRSSGRWSSRAARAWTTWRRRSRRRTTSTSRLLEPDRGADAHRRRPRRPLLSARAVRGDRPAHPRQRPASCSTARGTSTRSATRAPRRRDQALALSFPKRPA